MATPPKFKKPALDDPESIRKHWKILQTDLVAPTKKDSVTPHNINYAKLRAIVDSYGDKLNDAKGIMELLPDICLVRDILVASILSPKDLTDVALNITVDKDAPPELAELIRVHFSTVYNIDNMLAEILAKALFEEGCHVLMPLPPTAIRNMIHANTYSLEDNSKTLALHDIIKKGNLPNIGILEAFEKPVYALEELSMQLPNHTVADKGLIEITDNAMYLIYPALQEAVSHSKIKNTLRNAYGLEGLTDKRTTGEVYLKTNAVNIPTCMLEKGDAVKEEFNPVVLNLPPESVIPVYPPGEPTKHVGYIIIIDDEGYPIHLNNTSNKFRELNDRLNDTVAANATVINTSLSVTTSDKNKGDPVKPIFEAYIANLEKTLSDTLSKNSGIKSVEVTMPEEVYRVMFSRQLARQKTRMVYVPAEMLTYIAFNYNELGIGESLLEKTKLYASLRAILLFAQIMAGVKNSVNGRTLSITLDEMDTDPQGTVETILNEFITLQTASLPIGKLNPSDIINSLQRAGINIKVNGGSLFPGTAMDVAETKREIAMPDVDLSIMLKTAHYAGLWVSPELVDKSLEGDFATGIVASNLLQAKRVKLCQKQYTGHLSDFIHKYIYAGGPLFTEVKALYDKHKGSKLSLEQTIDSITVNLPKPDTAVLKSQYEEYQDYSTFIADALDLYITEGSLAGVELGDTTETIDAFKAEVIGYLKRQYLRNQNLLPEIDAGVTSSDSVMAAGIEEHNASVRKIALDMVKTIKGLKEKLAAMTAPPEDTETPDDATTTTDETPSDDTEQTDDNKTANPVKTPPVDG